MVRRNKWGVNGEAFSQQLDWEARQSYRADAPPVVVIRIALGMEWAYGPLGGDYTQPGDAPDGSQYRGRYSYPPSWCDAGATLQGSVALAEAPARGASWRLASR